MSCLSFDVVEKFCATSNSRQSFSCESFASCHPVEKTVFGLIPILKKPPKFSSAQKWVLIALLLASGPLLAAGQSVGTRGTSHNRPEGFCEVEGVAEAHFAGDLSHRLIRGIQQRAGSGHACVHEVTHRAHAGLFFEQCTKMRH